MRAWLGVVLVAGGATIAACSGPAHGPTAPSAAAGGDVSAASDGSTLKTSAPRIVSPTGGASVAATPILVAEPTVGFRYNITAHLVGNLLDLAFDGQSAITEREAQAPLRHYVGNLEFEPGIDVDWYQAFQGGKREFLELAPWVTADAPRTALLATGAQLAPGSGDALENDYLETAVWADLTR